MAALVGALLIQIGTNFANDYYDAEKGTDTEDRAGFTRVTAGGLIDPARVMYAMVCSYGLAAFVGLCLVYVGGLPILVVGLSSIAAGLLYTGGPYPYGYYGLGDVFVFLYFGLVAVVGTYYVQAVAALGAGPLPMAIRMLKYAFNMADDGMVGQQVFAGEATRLGYMTEEAQEGRDAFNENREPNFRQFPWHY